MRTYLTIIPLALMGSESIAHEAEVSQKNIETKHLSLVKAIVLVFKAGAFRY